VDVPRCRKFSHGHRIRLRANEYEMNPLAGELRPLELFASAMPERFRDIATSLGITKGRVSQLHKRALQSIRIGLKRKWNVLEL
jgi:hypothetical protein